MPLLDVCDQVLEVDLALEALVGHPRCGHRWTRRCGAELEAVGRNELDEGDPAGVVDLVRSVAEPAVVSRGVSRELPICVREQVALLVGEEGLEFVVAQTVRRVKISDSLGPGSNGGT